MGVASLSATSYQVGSQRVLEVSVTRAANAGEITLATCRTNAVIIDSIVVYARSAITTDMTTCGVFGGTDSVITFIDTNLAIRANLNALNKQVAWTGAVRLNTGETIVMNLVGVGTTAVDMTVAITYRVAGSGGYLA